MSGGNSKFQPCFRSAEKCLAGPPQLRSELGHGASEVLDWPVDRQKGGDGDQSWLLPDVHGRSDTVVLGIRSSTLDRTILSIEAAGERSRIGSRVGWRVRSGPLGVFEHEEPVSAGHYQGQGRIRRRQLAQGLPGSRAQAQTRLPAFTQLLQGRAQRIGNSTALDGPHIDELSQKTVRRRIGQTAAACQHRQSRLATLSTKRIQERKRAVNDPAVAFPLRGPITI